MKSIIRKNSGQEKFNSSPLTSFEVIDREENEEIYVGDDAVLSRLENIILAIKNGEYDEETKQAIYYYAENFMERTTDTEPSVYSKHVADARKYFVAGWWMYNMIEDQEKMTSTVIEKE